MSTELHHALEFVEVLGDYVAKALALSASAFEGATTTPDLLAYLREASRVWA
jgi:hypothetical protein